VLTYFWRHEEKQEKSQSGQFEFWPRFELELADCISKAWVNYLDDETY
jgi:hypothetical protein